MEKNVPFYIQQELINNNSKKHSFLLNIFVYLLELIIVKILFHF